jgi:glycosyltransferase involved in cell wall biosynthesis
VRIAVIHDWLGPMTGAERVLDHILRVYPGADVYTAIDFLPAQHRHVLHGSRVITSFIQKLPRARTKYWNYIPVMPLAFERFDLSGYDVIVSNSHTVAKGVVATADQVHVCYLETPMRFAWDLEEYYLDQFGVHGLKRLFARSVLRALRSWDVRSAVRVHEFVAVSQFVAQRCESFYGRKAAVVYPPVDVEFFTPVEVRREGYLVASRLTPFKHVDLIVEAFRDMPDRSLTVIGDGPDRKKILARCTSNITFLGYQPDEVLRDHMQRARAFLFSAPEDFGIVMAEAQSCGTPVIALGVGGACEIVRGLDADVPTGVLFDVATPAAVRDAVMCFENRASSFTPSACRTNALRFAPRLFREGLKSQVESALERHGQRSSASPLVRSAAG